MNQASVFPEFPHDHRIPQDGLKMLVGNVQEGYTLSTTHPDHFSGPNSIAFNDVWSTIQ